MPSDFVYYCKQSNIVWHVASALCTTAVCDLSIICPSFCIWRTLIYILCNTNCGCSILQASILQYPDFKLRFAAPSLQSYLLYQPTSGSSAKPCLVSGISRGIRPFERICLMALRDPMGNRLSLQWGRPLLQWRMRIKSLHCVK